MGVGKTSIYKCLNADFLDTRTKKTGSESQPVWG